MKTVLIGLVIMGALSAGAVAQEEFCASVLVDLGEDVGQNLGTLFEVRDQEGRTVAGAGFAGVYNTHARNDRFSLQFFVRPKARRQATVEPLPKPSASCGQYIFEVGGKTVARGEDGPSYWDGKQWVEGADDPLKVTRIAGGKLEFGAEGATYEGEVVLGKPKEGSYRNPYYARGHLLFYHAKTGEGAFTRVCAAPWKPGWGKAGAVPEGDWVVQECKYPGETPFVWGQLEGEVMTVSNLGGVYVFDGRKWRVLRQVDRSVSYQIYSSINYYNKLLLAQYPTGNLFVYDGKDLKQLPGWPPVMAGVSSSSREAQSTMLYGGDLYVGVWPWSELWRYERESDKWEFVRRMFTRPELTDKVTHPYEAEILAYNEAKGTKRVFNDWGQRLTSMTLWEDSLMLATSAKGMWARDPEYGFLTDEVCAEYGRITRLKLPGVVTAPVQWKTEPTRIRCVVEGERMWIEQDGKVIGETALPRGMMSGVNPYTIRWGDGVFGAAGVRLQQEMVQPRARALGG